MNTRRLSVPGWITLGLAAGLTLAFCLHMWPEWMRNPDLSHGLFAPLLFLILIYESRRNGPWRHPADSIALRVLRGTLLILSLAFVCIGGLYAAAVDWSHPLVDLSLALALSMLLSALLTWLANDRMRILSLNWPACIAIILWPFCAPLPPGVYSRLTLQLQSWVTEIVLNALHLLGIPASTAGNIIQLAHSSVGVEEACSGVRSLLSCVVASLFLSATFVRHPWARALIIVLAPPLAFGMNIIRSLGLTLLANAGVDISGTWHDVTGFAVLGVTVAMLGALAWLLEDRPSSPPPASQPAPPQHPWTALCVTTVATLLVVFFIFNTRRPPSDTGSIPNLEAILPLHPPGWDIVATEDLHRFSGILETRHLIQRTYVRHASSTLTKETAAPLQITVYLAYWPAGQATVSLVATHTPDACWPAGGWRMNPPQTPPQSFFVGERQLPVPEYRSFEQGSFVQNVWYWHLHDGRALSQMDPRSALSLLKLAWRHGFRTGGEQWFVRISSNHSWFDIQNDPLVNEIFNRLQPHGLYSLHPNRIHSFKDDNPI